MAAKKKSVKKQVEPSKPNKSGVIVDKYLRLHREIKDAEKKLEIMLAPKNEKLKELEQELFKIFREEKSEKIGSSEGTISYSKKPVPTAKDWEKVYAYIYKHKAGFLLEKRISVSAFRELLENGKTIPGVEKFERESLSVSFKQIKEK